MSDIVERLRDFVIELSSEPPPMGSGMVLSARDAIALHQEIERLNKLIDYQNGELNRLRAIVRNGLGPEDMERVI